jgi:hypothetical protein
MPAKSMEEAMALYDRRYDQSTPRSQLGTLLPFILAAAVAAILMMTMFFPRPAPQVGDAGMAPSVSTSQVPSTKTMTPVPTPSTTPLVPTPSPTDEPRPTQAPIQ